MNTDVKSNNLPYSILLLSSLLLFFSSAYSTCFTGPEFALSYQSAYSLTTADFNGDIYTDLILCSSHSNPHFNIYLGSANGTFTLRESKVFYYPVQYIVESVSDVNNDGFNDLLFTHNEGFALFFGDGDGSMNYQYSYLGAINGLYVCGLEDFSEDGFPDLYGYIKKPGHSPFVSINDGNGVFNSWWTDNSYYHYSNLITSADMNLDGSPDIAAIYYNSDSTAVYLGNGTPEFGEPLLSPASIGNGLGSLVCGNLNSDIIPDAVTIKSFDINLTELWIFFGTAEGKLEPVQRLFWEDSLTFDISANPILADFNSDGYMDVSLQGTPTQILPGYEGGFLDHTTTGALFYLENGATSIDTTDLDKDGDIDLLVLSEDNIVNRYYNQTISSGVHTTFPATGIHSLTVSPNPSQGSLLVELPLSFSTSDCLILNASGHQVQEFQTPVQDSFTLNLEKYPSGLYFIRVETTAGELTEKFLIL